jgi:hypothetical protein
MTTDHYIPGVCISCSAEAPVLLIPGYGDLDLGCDGHRCCKACNDALTALLRQGDYFTDGPTGWWPGVETDHPDWY